MLRSNVALNCKLGHYTKDALGTVTVVYDDIAGTATVDAVGIGRKLTKHPSMNSKLSILESKYVI